MNELRLIAMTRVELEGVALQYVKNPDPDVFEAEMRRVLTRAHSAAALSGAGERSLGSRIRVFLAKVLTTKLLPAEDKALIRSVMKEQFEYLRGFKEVLADLSPAQVVVRAQSYAGAVRATYSRARWSGLDLPFHPGDGGTRCLGNCKCRWRVEGNKAYWELGGAERHCSDCPARAANSPYEVSR